MTFFSQILEHMKQLLEQGDPDTLIGARINAKGETVCYYCGELPDFRGLNLEHVAPQSLGGTSDPWNIVLACFNCNQRKKAKTPSSWFLEEQPTLSNLPNEISIDLLARLLINLHTFMNGKDVSKFAVLLGINEVGYIPRFEGDYQRSATVNIGSKQPHRDFECPDCHSPSIVECSVGIYIVKTSCPNCGRLHVYQGFPLISKK